MKFSNESFIKKDMKIFPILEKRSVKKDDCIEKNVNLKACSKCGGICCKNCGCRFSPDDFKELSYKYLKKEINKGYISIIYYDKWQTQDVTGAFVLRMRNYGAPIVDLGSIFHDGCILLTKRGCPLPYNKRPTGARLLVPKALLEVEGFCHQKYTIQQCCYEWMPYKKTLYRLYKHFKNRNIVFYGL